MNPERRYLEAARRRAQSQLPSDFAERVIRDADYRRRRLHYSRLTVITAAACLAVAVASHMALRAVASNANMATWNETQQQVIALEESL
jgi:hypothetical protein